MQNHVNLEEEDIWKQYQEVIKSITSEAFDRDLDAENKELFQRLKNRSLTEEIQQLRMQFQMVLDRVGLERITQGYKPDPSTEDDSEEYR